MCIRDRVRSARLVAILRGVPMERLEGVVSALVRGAIGRASCRERV